MTAKDKKLLISRLDSTQKLVESFGLQARAFDPGVHCSLGDEHLYFGYSEWKWLEPILRELLVLRMKLRK